MSLYSQKLDYNFLKWFWFIIWRNVIFDLNQKATFHLVGKFGSCHSFIFDILKNSLKRGMVLLKRKKNWPHLVYYKKTEPFITKKSDQHCCTTCRTQPRAASEMAQDICTGVISGIGSDIFLLWKNVSAGPSRFLRLRFHPFHSAYIQL